MSDLGELDAAATPRPEELCRRFAAKVEPAAGFVVYGLLYVFGATWGMCGGALIATVVIVPLCHFANVAADSLPVTLITIVFSVAGYAWAWLFFVRWVRRKRARAAMLIREGELVSATLTTGAADRAIELAASFATGLGRRVPNVEWTRLEFEYAGTRRHVLAPFPHDAALRGMRVLYHPASSYALAFDGSGRACVVGS